jgi:transposase
VGHAGLDPRPYDSGTSVHRPRRISKVGNRHSRAALYMAALVAIRRDPNVKAFERLAHIVSRPDEHLTHPPFVVMLSRRSIAP